MQWQTITIVGVGLLGGSIGLYCRKNRIAARVIGLVRRPESIKECTELGAVDHATTDPAEAIKDSELLVFCTGISEMKSLLARMLTHLKPGTIVTDVGSVKAPVVRDLEPLAKKAGAHFVGAHPMAGSEKTGVANARADLFKGAVCVVTPTPRTNSAALCAVKSFWQALGAIIVEMSPNEHDLLVAYGSHLPHVTAVALTATVLDGKRKQQEFLCATGFKDTTRIASSNSQMWCDILLTNRKNVIRAIDSFTRELAKIRNAVASGNQKKVTQLLSLAKSRRDEWCRAKDPLANLPAASSQNAGVQIPVDFKENTGQCGKNVFGQLM